VEADFDHGSVSIAFRLPRRHGRFGRFGPEGTLVADRRQGYQDSFHVEGGRMKSRLRRAPLGAVALVVATLAVVAGGAATAGLQAEGDGTIRACRHKSGYLLVPSSGKSCKRSEQALSWNVAGPAGPAGPTGPAGATGPAGPPGRDGEDGEDASLASIEALREIACRTAEDEAGKVAVETEIDGAIVLSCERASAPPPPPASAQLVLNEIDYDQVGADGDGFVEIYNAGDGAVDLSAIDVVFVDGSDGAEYLRKPLTGTLGAGEYVVVAGEAQNGAPDGVALIDTADGELLDALSYEGSITAATIGTSSYDLVEGSALPAAVADSNTVDGSLARIPNGSDTDDAATDWAFTGTVTPGAANAG
jgi:hypothetical protein